MLSDRDIIAKIASGEIEIVDPSGISVIEPKTGREREPGQLQSHGYDLRIEAVYPWGSDDWHELQPGETYTLQPSEFIAVKTYERVRLCGHIAATIHAMARRTLLGLIHISTTVHPGWAETEEEGPQPFYIAVSNISKAPIKLGRGQQFCRVLFHELVSEAALPPPNLSMIKRDFEDIRYNLAKKYGIRNKVLGWLILFLSVVLAGLILFTIESYVPQYISMSIALVVAVLSLVMAAIRRRFNIVN